MQANSPSASSVRTIAGLCARGVLAIGLIFAVDHAFAGGKVYRCGNAFQDQPCATETVPAAKVASRDTVPAASVPKGDTRPAAGANDRLIVDPPRAVVLDVRH
jgi:hypothetical protein